MSGPREVVTPRTFRECGICGALFMPDREDVHQRWHDALAPLLNAEDPS